MRSKEIIQFLNSIQGKKVIAKSSGYIAFQTIIYKLEYIINYGIVTIKDKQTENFMVVDLRKIKELTINKEKISIQIFINDEVETEIVIEEIS